MDQQISQHLCRVFIVVKATPDWLTSKEIAAQAHVAERTARLHLLSLVQVRLLDQAEVFPGYRYRLSKKYFEPGRAMLKRIESACSVFGLD